MKNYLLICLLAGSMCVTAQAYPDLTNNQEIKFNIGLFIATTAIEFSYEYFLSEDTSLGGTVFFANGVDDYTGDFGIGPNFRAYFGQEPRSGFFAEAFGLYYTGEEEVEDELSGAVNEEFSSLALGIGLGKKWVIRSQKFAFEFNGGFGRSLNPEDFQDEFVYRIGLSAGFRF